MFSIPIELRIALAGVLFSCGAAALGQSPTPTPDVPSSELPGSFSLTSTRKDGKLEWKVEGTSASFLTPEIIELTNVNATNYEEDGRSTIATTSKAVVNKETRQITTDEFVTIVTEDSVTTAIGLYWDQKQQKGHFKKDVKVIYTQSQGTGLIQ